MSETNIAREALHQLELRGWTQGQYENGDGAVCLMGALGYADDAVCNGQITSDNRDAFRLADYTVGCTIREQFPDRTIFGSAAAFNDHGCTTIADVVLVLEKSAVKIDEAI